MLRALDSHLSAMQCNAQAASQATSIGLPTSLSTFQLRLMQCSEPMFVVSPQGKTGGVTPRVRDDTCPFLCRHRQWTVISLGGLDSLAQSKMTCPVSSMIAANWPVVHASSWVSSQAPPRTVFGGLHYDNLLHAAFETRETRILGFIQIQLTPQPHRSYARCAV